MKNNLIVSIVILVLFIAGISYIVTTNKVLPPVTNLPISTDPYRATLTGTYVCLPHTDTTGPQTLECALGMQTDNGLYYALDFQMMSQTPPDLATGEHFMASGIVTPVQNLSTNHWQKYPIVGIFSVTDSLMRI